MVIVYMVASFDGIDGNVFNGKYTYLQILCAQCRLTCGNKFNILASKLVNGEVLYKLFLWTAARWLHSGGYLPWDGYRPDYIRVYKVRFSLLSCRLSTGLTFPAQAGSLPKPLPKTHSPTHSFLRRSFPLKSQPFKYPAPAHRYVAKPSQPRYGTMHQAAALSMGHQSLVM